MKKTLDLQLTIDESSPVPVYEQLAAEMRRLICAQTFAVGEQIPSIRVVAAHLNVSPTTVRRGFQILIDEGWLDQHRGSGTYVSAALELQRKYLGTTGGAGAPPLRRTLDVSDALLQGTWAAHLSTVDACDGRRGGAPAPPAVDLTTFTTLTDPAGLLALRDTIAKSISVSRSLKCTAGDIIITSGSQQSRSMFARLFAREGATIVIEDPCDPLILRLFQSFGWNVLSIPVDDSGIVIEELDRIDSADAIYLTPSSQSLTGAVLSKMRRERIAAWSQKTGAIIIEDDEGCDLTYENRVTAAVHSFADAGRTIYIGDLSQIVPNSWQIGFMVVPPAMRETFYRMKLVADRCTPPMLQTTLQEMWKDGHVERNLTKQQREFGRIRNALVDRLAVIEGITFTPVKGGLRQVVWLSSSQNDIEISEACRNEGIDVRPVSPSFRRKPARPGLTIDFSNVDIAGVDRLVEVLRACIG